MKQILSTLVYLLMINSLSAVNKYSVGDILYVIDENVSLLSEPNSNSKVLNKLSKGSLIRTLETKFDKSGDIRLGDDNIKWKSILTGKWIKIKFEDKIGYVFDVYLFHYNLKELLNSELCISRDTISVQDYETYTRSIYLNGVINENGLGMEWGKEVFMVPDFTFEEALLFIKPNMIDYSYGKQDWEINDNRIRLKESDGISSRQLEIVRYGEYVIIEITDGV